MYVSSNASNLYDLLNNISNEYRRNDRINSKEVDASEQVSKGGDVEARNAYSVGEPTAIDPNDAKFANAISADDQGGAKTLFLATLFGQQGAEGQNYTGSVHLDTSHGRQFLDMTAYFSPPPPGASFKIDEIPLLTPSPHNIKALSKHVAQQVKGLLSQYDIPEGPSKISFNSNGEMVLPADYPYKDEFKAALAENPVIERQLSTLSALSSQFSGISAAMQGNGHSPAAKIELSLGEDGTITVLANGKSLSLRNAAETASASTDQDNEDDEEDASNADFDPEEWFMDYMSKSPEERYVEDILRELGLTPEEYAALPPEEKLEIDEKIQQRMEEDTKNGSTLV